MKGRLDLCFIHNDRCQKGCNSNNRKGFIENDLCSETNSVLDNLPIRCVGEWAEQKIYHLVQYFGIFSNGMKDKWKGELNYIEICSGPGRCVARENGSEFDGTALSILKHSAIKNIRRALFFDVNEIVVDTLNQRIRKLNIDNARALIGDYSKPDLICDIIKQSINPNSLNLIFIDPTDCSVPFSLISKIKLVLVNVDFIINLASGTDYNRNITNALLDQDSYTRTISKYSKFLGTADFFKDPVNIKLAQERRNIDLRNNFRESYTQSLKTIGYEYFAFKRI
jgi:three-Cys-motif partner protein